MFASHSINQGCLVNCDCFTTGSSRASFLGVQPSECHKYTEETRGPPRTFTHAWAILPSLPGIESIAPSCAPTTAPKLLSIATKTPPHVCFSPRLLQISILSWLLFLNCPSVSAFIILRSNLKKISHSPLCLLIYFFSVLHADPLNRVHLNLLASFFISVLSSPFGCFYLFGGCVRPPVFFDPHFLLHPDHCLRPSLWSLCLLTLSKLIKKRKSHFPNFPKVCLASGRLSLFIAFLFFFAFLQSCHGQTHDELFFFFFFLHFSSTVFFFFELATFPPDGFYLQGCLGPSPECFLQKFLGPYPGCFFLFSLANVLHLSSCICCCCLRGVHEPSRFYGPFLGELKSPPPPLSPFASWCRAGSKKQNQPESLQCALLALVDPFGDRLLFALAPFGLFSSSVFSSCHVHRSG